jgi:hypothetical protein
MSTVDLRGDVVPVDVARHAVPAEPGLYAWWSRPGALPGITGPRHPDGEHELVYVGLARSGPSSRATLRSRVVGNHEARHLGYTCGHLRPAWVLQGRGWQSAR